MQHPRLPIHLVFGMLLLLLPFPTNQNNDMLGFKNLFTKGKVNYAELANEVTQTLDRYLHPVTGYLINEQLEDAYFQQMVATVKAVLKQSKILIENFPKSIRFLTANNHHLKMGVLKMLTNVTGTYPPSWKAKPSEWARLLNLSVVKYKIPHRSLNKEMSENALAYINEISKNRFSKLIDPDIKQYTFEKWLTEECLHLVGKDVDGGQFDPQKMKFTVNILLPIYFPKGQKYKYTGALPSASLMTTAMPKVSTTDATNTKSATGKAFKLKCSLVGVFTVFIATLSFGLLILNNQAPAIFKYNHFEVAQVITKAAPSPLSPGFAIISVGVVVVIGLVSIASGILFWQVWKSSYKQQTKKVMAPGHRHGSRGKETHRLTRRSPWSSSSLYPSTMSKQRETASVRVNVHVLKE